ncbi:hypothetical protein BC831DRAFT_126969 [Entophlyctis helioformis]|nr:hypothetical protein BC831DRAFT_126969 [Entophlyctis helioformis]
MLIPGSPTLSPEPHDARSSMAHGNETARHGKPSALDLQGDIGTAGRNDPLDLSSQMSPPLVFPPDTQQQVIQNDARVQAPQSNTTTIAMSSGSIFGQLRVNGRDVSCQSSSCLLQACTSMPPFHHQSSPFVTPSPMVSVAPAAQNSTAFPADRRQHQLA